MHTEQLQQKSLSELKKILSELKKKFSILLDPKSNKARDARKKASWIEAISRVQRHINFCADFLAEFILEDFYKLQDPEIRSLWASIYGDLTPYEHIKRRCQSGVGVDFTDLVYDAAWASATADFGRPIETLADLLEPDPTYSGVQTCPEDSPQFRKTTAASREARNAEPTSNCSAASATQPPCTTNALGISDERRLRRLPGTAIRQGSSRTLSKASGEPKVPIG